MIRERTELTALAALTGSRRNIVQCTCKGRGIDLDKVIVDCIALKYCVLKKNKLTVGFMKPVVSVSRSGSQLESNI